MVIWMSTVNSSILDLLDFLKNNKLSKENGENFEKLLHLIEEGLKEKIKLQDELDVISLIDILKILYNEFMKKEEDIADLNEKDEMNEDKIRNQKAQIDNLTLIRHTYEYKIKELEEANEEKTIKIQELNHSLQKKSLTINSLKQEVVTLQDANDANEYEYNVKITELENQIERITNSENHLKNELERHIDNANNEKDNFHNVISKEQENVIFLLKENDTLKSENKDLNSKIKDYETKLLNLEDLAQLYNDCLVEKKQMESELHNYREIMNDPEFQKKYFNDIIPNILLNDEDEIEGEADDDDDEKNAIFSDRSETLKEELDKINKTLDENNSEFKSIKNVHGKITHAPDILNLIEERQKKFEKAVAEAVTVEANILSTKMENNETSSSDDDSSSDDSNSDSSYYKEGAEHSRKDENDSNHSDSVTSVDNGGIFDDNSSFFLENSTEYKQSKVNQFLQLPSNDNNTKKQPKSQKVKGCPQYGKTSQLSTTTTTTLAPQTLHFSVNKTNTQNNSIKSETKATPNLLLKKVNTIITSVNSMLERINETDLKILNKQLRKSFDMVELVNLSNKILQNIQSDIELFHKRYPLMPIPEDQLKKSNNNNNNVDKVKGENDSTSPTDGKKKYTEDSVALNTLALTFQTLLNDLCTSKMLTNDYGKLYFQEIESASRKEAEKFLNANKEAEKQTSKATNIFTRSISNNSKTTNTSAAPAKFIKSNSFIASKPIAINKKGEPEGITRHYSLIRNPNENKPNTLVRSSTSLTRYDSFIENNFLNTWADAIKNIFKDNKEEEVKEKERTPFATNSSTNSSSRAIPTSNNRLNDNKAEPTREATIAEKFASISFMDFFKFKKSTDDDKDKESQKMKKESNSVEREESSTANNTYNNREHLTVDTNTSVTAASSDGAILSEECITVHIQESSPLKLKSEQRKSIMVSSPTAAENSLSSIPIQNTPQKHKEVEQAFSYNSSDISISSACIEPLTIPIKDPQRLIEANAVLSSSPYYHYDGQEIKPFSFNEDEKPSLLSTLSKLVPPTNNNFH